MRNFFDKLTAFLVRSDGSVRQRTIRSGIWISIASGFMRIFEFSRTIVLARLLMPEVFGIMTIVLFVRGAVEVLTNTSFKSALIYRQDDIEDAANTAWTLNILRGIFLFALMFAIAPFVAIFYKEPVLSTAIKIIAFAFIVESFSNINMVVFEKNLDYRVITITRIVSSFINISVVLLLAWYYRSVYALLLGNLFSSIINTVITYWIQPVRPKLYFNKKIALELFHYAKFVTGSGVLVFITLNAADMVLGKLLNMEQLGYYSYAFTLANLPSTHITSVISEVIFPAYNAVKSDLDKLRHAFLKIFSIIAVFSIPAAFGIMALSREIIVLMFGAKWEAAVAPLRVLIVFGLIRSLAATTGPVLNAIGKQNLVFWIVFSKLCLIVSIMYPCVVRWGIVGGAIALTLPMMLEQLFLWVVIKRYLNLNPVLIAQAIVKPLVYSVFMYLALIGCKLLFPITTIPLLISCVSIGAIVYSLQMWIFSKNVIRDFSELRS